MTNEDFFTWLPFRHLRFTIYEAVAISDSLHVSCFTFHVSRIFRGNCLSSYHPPLSAISSACSFLLSAFCFLLWGLRANLFDHRLPDHRRGRHEHRRALRAERQPGPVRRGGPLTSGPYSVTGGFWALPQAVPASDTPRLTIKSSTPGYAIVSWSPATNGFVLQEKLSLGSTNWIDSTSGAANPVTVPAALPVKFYRLRKFP